MNGTALWTMALLGLLAASLDAGEIGFPEDFALAKDRSVPLKQLIPGTEDYYFYNCVNYQNMGRLDEVDRTLKLWIERYQRTARVVEIENRQALLRYTKDPNASLTYIRNQLSLTYPHQRVVPGQKPQLPTSLDAKLISRETLTQIALQRFPGTLQGFEQRADDWLVAAALTPDRRRHLLERLRRPDYANLPKLVVDDLNFQNSRGFGSFEIHRLLLLPQLEECLRLKPDLLNQTNFVNVYLNKLWPSPDADWEHNDAERLAYLERLSAFVARLNPSHNSLIASVLYHRLVYDRAHDVYDPDRFLAYVKLPRNVNYINVKYMEQADRRRYAADLNANFQQFTLLPPVGDDEPLVRSYLEHFFLDANAITPYDTYINDIYLKRVFAETKIVNGVGNMEQWYSMLPPELYQALKERVDIDFAYTTKNVYAPDEKVGLDVYVKNAKTLIVNVYELNALNYYLATQQEVNTAINLDGLVANDEKTYTYDDPPLRRVKRHFDFPNLTARGTYIIDFIGNGRSSRAVVRKGRLQFLVRTSVAGQVFAVFDEANRKVTDASLWLAGRQFAPDKEGAIAVPFSNQPGRQTIIVTQGNFAWLDHFQQEAEQYRLGGGIYVDREALLRRKKASVIVRPALYLNGAPAPVAILEEPTLTISSTDIEGVSTAKEVSDFKLYGDRESVYEFQVPASLVSIAFTVKAKVQNLSQGKKIDLTLNRGFQLNGIDRTDKIEDLLLSQVDGNYVLDVLGKTGEIRADRPVSLALKHRDFTQPVNVSLQTDARGRVALGALEGIERISATGPEGTTESWGLHGDLHSYRDAVQGRVGEPILVPYMGREAKPTRAAFSLLEERGNTFLKDWFDALSIKGGYLQLQGLPPGNYSLLLKEVGEQIAVRVTQGEEREGYALGSARYLEVLDPKPLQIAAVAADKDTLKVRLENASKLARVHVFATRYLPEYPVFAGLGVDLPEPYAVSVPTAESLYVVGRDIGEEYRYILERKYAKKYPGNMLTRPKLLLNPWAIHKTETTSQEAKAGEEFERLEGAARGGRARMLARHGGTSRAPGQAFFSDLDFLGEPAAVLVNLRPDNDGVVTVKRADLGAHPQVRVVAIDPHNTVYRDLSLPEMEMRFEDLRLLAGLDPKEHFTEQKQVTVVKPEGQFVLPDIATSEFEAYDTLGKVYALYATLSSNPTLVEFGFILNWPKLKPEEKRTLYSKHACHELTFFLSKKDPDFFKAVILPYLKNKKDKTFLDRWLLGDDLSGYLRPWPYGQLNTVERILLGRRIAGEEPHAARHVKDLFDLIPPDIERANFLFKTALRGSALETADQFGFAAGKADAKAEGKPQAMKLAELRRAVPTTAAAPAEAPAAPPPAPAKAPARDEAKKAALEQEELADKDISVNFVAEDLVKRKSVRQFFRQLEKTEEWAENNYYHLPIEQQNASLITVNAFWNDYARHDGKTPFFSTHFPEASRNFPEMMLALAVLDLPFEAAKAKSEVQGARFSLAAASPMVIFHKEIKAAQPAAEKTPILVSENFYRASDRYRYVDNERLDKYVTGEFLTHVVYGCQVVVTNPTSSRQRLDVLLQIPRGAIPVQNGFYTRSAHLDLEPYRTQTIDYCFYFPAPGELPHYAVQVAKAEKLIASGEPAALTVLEKPSKIDTASWDYVSQMGTEDQVITYLQDNNLGRVNLEQIAWRMRDAAFLKRVLALLDQRHAYHNTLSSYALLHNDLPAARQFLQHADAFVSQCGAYIDTPLLTIDPVVRKTYQHLEYWPLVNARTYPLGKTRKILNDRFYAQYMRLVSVLSYRPALDDDDLMSVTCYLLLQDRVEEALGFLERVDPRKLATSLQHDYFQVYLDFYTGALPQARALAAKYADHPVDRWRDLFQAALAQLDEIEGKAVKVVNPEDQTQVQTRLAATEGSFEFKVEGGKVNLLYQNLAQATVNYYQMDIELLFSRNPFVQEYSGQFDYIRPNSTEALKLDPQKTSYTFDVPARYHNANVLIQIVAGGQQKVQAYYSNALALQIIGSYGQVKVANDKTAKPLPGVYVKAYARMKDGAVRYYKDGYTDLRGRFDYASLSTNELDNVEKFSLLVLSEADGAVVREAAPPKQ